MGEQRNTERVVLCPGIHLEVPMGKPEEFRQRY